MSVFEQVVLFVGLMAYASAQWVRYTNYFPDSPPDFLIGATPEQIEEFKHIIGDHKLSAKEYNSQMEALVLKLNPSAQEKYMKPIREAEEQMRTFGLKFLELTSNLPQETSRIARQLYDVVMAIGEYTSEEIKRKKNEILATVSKDTMDQLKNAYSEAVRLVHNNDK